MWKQLWNTVKVCPSLLGAYLLCSGVALAAPEVPASSEIAQSTPVDTNNLEQIQQYANPEGGNGNSSDSMSQVTNVSQFSDVESTDWAYEALSRVVEKYGCLQGYPDGTYRGKRALSRYEFAAGLNACLRQIEALIEAKGQNYVLKEDFEALQRLVAEFRTELATLGSRVDNLEARTDFLESHQFSTTTKLAGEAIFAIADVFGEERASRSGDGGDLDINTTFSNRVRLNFDTSFTGKDRLRTRLQARNSTPFDSNVTGTNMTRLGFDGDEGNDVFLSRLQYQSPLGDKAKLIVEATGAEWNDTLESFAGVFESSGTGSISRFGRYNPIYRQSRDGAGAAIRFDLSKNLGLSLAYAAPGGEANNPDEGGLFNGSYAALAQVAFKPTDAISLGLTYVRSLNQIGEVDLTGGTGSALARRPFGNGVETTSNQFALEALFRPSKSIQLSGWVGFTDAQAEDGTGRDAEIWNYAVALGFPDLGKKGNLLGFVFGMPPKATSIQGATADLDTSFHLEGFYRYRLTDNIEITPGLVVLLNPEHNDNNETQYVGVIRTTFKF
jgi:BMFP domain-containing protein YqiC